MTGGAIDLSGNDDPRAAELERRIVLSQYVMAVHDAGSLPPQETGLGVNSWYGKFHMEMYWWHAAHWALWGHPEILEKSLSHLTQLMPPAARWPNSKAQGREVVEDDRSQRHREPIRHRPGAGLAAAAPIYLAELVWRARKDKATLERYKDIVFETADYMATFVDYDPQRKEYVLGPGINSADEKHTRLRAQPQSHDGARLLEVGARDRPAVAHPARARARPAMAERSSTTSPRPPSATASIPRWRFPSRRRPPA
jgi:hypothetical protein